MRNIIFSEKDATEAIPNHMIAPSILKKNSGYQKSGHQVEQLEKEILWMHQIRTFDLIISKGIFNFI